MSHPTPTTMQAVQQDEPGGRLIVREVAVPQPKAGQVLVRMAAASINPSDLGSL
jgi:NADPH:quinone reductase-like Zn-dependent oxidoreductase